MNGMDQRFVAAPLVQVITAEGGEAVLLDLQTDRFLGIDQMSTLMWTLFTTGHTPQEVVYLIADRYMLESVESLHEDIVHFLQHMQTQHLLLPVQNIPTPETFPHQVKSLSLGCIPLRFLTFLATIRCSFPGSEWLEAWFLLRWVHSFLIHGKLLDLSMRLHALPTKRLITYETPDVRRLAQCVQTAAAWQPFKAVCLHQNLALGFMLRYRLLHADLVIGVSTFPFFAHAWLQSCSEVINWKTGLGPSATLQRLHELSLIFCTEWISDEGVMNGGKS